MVPGSKPSRERPGSTSSASCVRCASRFPSAATRSPVGPTASRCGRSFPARDDAAWLAVNNRAFAADPDQSGWDEAMLRARRPSPGSTRPGSCSRSTTTGWPGSAGRRSTRRRHRPSASRSARSTSSASTPDTRASGLGRALVVAGLESLAGRGIRTGMLFVDAANSPAVAPVRDARASRRPGSTGHTGRSCEHAQPVRHEVRHRAARSWRRCSPPGASPATGSRRCGTPSTANVARSKRRPACRERCATPSPVRSRSRSTRRSVRRRTTRRPRSGCGQLRATAPRSRPC